MSTETADTLETPNLSVFSGMRPIQGRVNATDQELLANIRHSIRLGHPQVRPMPKRKDRICLVGGGPSLDSTLDELRALYFEGAKVVTLNGAYQWCIERNIRPTSHIVMDARAFNARFLVPAVPGCIYLLASQCHPDTWAVVDGRPEVYIWHAIGPDEETEALLNEYYTQNRWCSIGHGPVGGTTAGVRAIALLRTLGFLRFDLFGLDSCVLDGAHHAYAQPENDADRSQPVTIHPKHPTLARTFQCAKWHLKQLECFLQMIRVKGNDFVLRVHGPGMLAYVLETAAAFEDATIAGQTGISEE